MPSSRLDRWDGCRWRVRWQRQSKKVEGVAEAEVSRWDEADEEAEVSWWEGAGDGMALAESDGGGRAGLEETSLEC